MKATLRFDVHVSRTTGGLMSMLVGPPAVQPALALPPGLLIIASTGTRMVISHSRRILP